MSKPLWLARQTVETIHDEQIARHGGAWGQRGEDRLEKVLVRPRNAWGHGETNIAALAASYAFGLARNHTFADGNKRTAFLAAYTFLGINGRVLTAPEAEAVVLTLALAAGEVDEAGYAAWLGENC